MNLLQRSLIDDRQGIWGVYSPRRKDFLTPARNLAVLIDTHNVDHAILVLSQISYTRVPVVTDQMKYVGTISLTDILSYQMKLDYSDEVFSSMDIVHMTKRMGSALERLYCDGSLA